MNDMFKTKMKRIPHIMYWKWDKNILKPGVLEAGIEDIFNRSNFDVHYLSFHHTEVKMRDPRLLQKIKHFSEALRERECGLVLDIDARDELGEFVDLYPEECAWFISLEEVKLDENGRASHFIKQSESRRWDVRRMMKAEKIVQAAAVKVVDTNNKVYEQATDVTEKIKLAEQEDGALIEVDLGADYAGWTLVAFPAVRHVMPDYYSPKLYEYFTELYKSVKDYSLLGSGTDEWGASLTLSPGDLGPVCRHFPWSEGMDKAYQKQYNESLNQNLLHLFYSEANPAKRHRVINQYISCFRKQIVDNEAWIYDNIKKHFGQEAFVGVHPTWIGSADNFYLETFYNGINWWEVKRDYAQTDEQVIFPIRLALQHRWDSPVWLNMFYTRNEPIENHIIETWTNACFGGRTHQLSYEAGGEVHCEFKYEDKLERLWAMEAKIEKLNQVQKSVPDSRIAIIFSMAAISNWALDNNLTGSYTLQHEPMSEVLKFTQVLFERNWLCDLIPDTEIENGSFSLKNGSARYGSQSYDAVVLIQAEMIHKSVLTALQEYSQSKGNLAIMGDCQRFFNGEDAATVFNETQQLATWSRPSFNQKEDLDALETWLETKRIPRNKWDKGCVLQDGSLLFAAKGADKPTGNALNVDIEYKGQRLVFEGEDFLHLTPEANGNVKNLAFGSAKTLHFMDKSLI